MRLWNLAFPLVEIVRVPGDLAGKKSMRIGLTKQSFAMEILPVLMALGSRAQVLLTASDFMSQTASASCG